MPLIETKGAGSAQGFGEFAQSGPVNYIEDVFSTYLYTGNGSTQTITNSIDLSTKGGLVWTKLRNAITGHALADTAQGIQKILQSNSTAAQQSYSGYITSFNSNGYDFGDASVYNDSLKTFVSWTFREQPKFFDVVTYTGNGQNDRQVAHSLGSTPGCIIVKCLSFTGGGGPQNWSVYHRSISPSQSLFLNTTAAAAANDGLFGTATSTYFVVNQPGGANTLNANGDQYVAYLFAHDAGGFGLTGSDNVISCGGYTGSTLDVTVNLGWEPQFILLKQTGSTYASSDWFIWDSMRPLAVGGSDSYLRPNLDAAEGAFTNAIDLTSTGFIAKAGVSGSINNTSGTYIYIAIRRGPMKVPTSGTSVFGLNKYSNTTDYQQITTGNLVDLGWQVLNGDGYKFFTRLIGSGYLNPTSTSVENTSAATKFDYMDGFAPYYANSVGAFNPREVYGFRRAPSFSDVVCYTGTGSNTTINHNLGVVPELMIFKTRTGTARAWGVYSNAFGVNKKLVLNTTAAVANDSFFVDTIPTTTVFYPGNANESNESGNTYVAYLFATCAGVSKVGSYTGTGTTLQVNCGFTGGSRFVLIKRTDSTGDWYVWDSARGIVAGNDPYLLLNSTAAEVTGTDYVDTYSAGFEISSTAPAGINANGGTYIFLAIA